MSAREIIDIYVQFFVKRGHKQIPNSPLIPQNDPTTLFTSSGMQPLITYLLGEPHPSGNRLVDVQNSFRAQDIEEVGDNRHTTFFRMLGNWSLGDYFKAEEIPWLWEFLTWELGLPKEKLYITVFDGGNGVEQDTQSYELWFNTLKDQGFNPDERIFWGDVSSNWWSRSGLPENMPIGEPGGPDTEVFYRFDDIKHKKECKDNPVDCKCGKFLEIANSVFMQYVKTDKGFENLPKQNVDFGGGLERLLAAVENKSDIFQTSLFAPIIKALEDESGKSYKEYEKEMRIIADHLIASVFIASEGVNPSNKEQGYILRRLLRRAFDNLNLLELDNLSFVLEKIVEQYSQTDEILKENYENIKNTILEEQQNYEKTINRAEKLITTQQHITGKARIITPSNNKPNVSKETIERSKKVLDEIMGVKKISAEDAFKMYTTHGLSPTQIKSLGYVFNEQEFANLMEAHQKLSRAGATKKFAGGLADHSDLTIMGHTATHLLHQALRDVLGESVHQTGSNITSERIRFDFNFDRLLNADELERVESIVNGKIEDNLEVHFQMMPLTKAKEIGAIGLFDEKYAKDVKVYFIGNYSVEFCGGPHVDFTGRLERFKIIKQENLGKGQKRIYSKVGSQI